jgi:hypothetical protein
VPFLRCPGCDDIAEIRVWQPPPGDDFRRVCPACGEDFDISDLQSLLRDPRVDAGP